MTHELIRRRGRLQCTGCRAAFVAVRPYSFQCPGEPLAHGLTPEHVVYPKGGDHSCETWGCDEPDPSHWHGPDPYCDELTCRTCLHNCDCDVCTGALEAPGLVILYDFPYYITVERERDARMAKDLNSQLADIEPGDYLTVTGSDTRGHEVTKTGYLLTRTQPVQAQRIGKRRPAVRLNIGAEGQDPQERNTWIHVFDDFGSVKHVEPPKPGEWFNTPLREIPGIKAVRPDGDIKPLLLFGGKGGKRSQEPTTRELVELMTPSVTAKYQFRSVKTGEVLHEAAMSGAVWWATPPEEDEKETFTADDFKAAIHGRGPELEDNEHQDDEPEDQEPETPPRKWKKHRMSRFVNWSGRRVFFYYGGLAKKAVNENGPLVYVSWKESYEGTNTLRHAETGEVIDTVHSMANVWGIPAEEPEGFTDPKAEPAAEEAKDPLLDLIEETAPPKGGYEVPANFLELAEEGNTDQAKAYWKRRCEEYRRTGK